MSRLIDKPVGRTLVVFFAAMLLMPLLVRPSLADERGREYRRESPERWHGGDIHRFHERDIAIWRGGHWRHGRHAGRQGWWWVVGGVWYYYPVMVKPYPDPYLPPLVEMPPPPPAAPATSQFWYYCRNPAGYYPYVPSCPTSWEAVPANAPSAPLK
ncbi:MAG: hypothetical protein NT159_12000 [Proteobacteria bacterium]|nr:hypothetical protein [Pseudomonadota bacterium]